MPYTAGLFPIILSVEEYSHLSDISIKYYLNVCYYLPPDPHWRALEVVIREYDQ